MPDTVVECKKCKKKRSVDFGDAIRYGWPKCCDQTMTLLKTDADIEKEVGIVVDNAVAKVLAMRSHF